MSPSSSISGVRAKITSVYGKVCGQGTSKDVAFGAAWADATYVGADGKDEGFAQAGFLYMRAQGTLNVFRCRFAECQGNSYHYLYDTDNPPPAQGANDEYKCELDVSANPSHWNFKDNGTKFATLPPSSDTFWDGKTANAVKWSGEIRNYEDDMPGTYPSQLCIFADCGYSENGGVTYDDPGITANDMFATWPTQHGNQRVSTTEFYIWDKHRLP